MSALKSPWRGLLTWSWLFIWMLALTFGTLGWACYVGGEEGKAICFSPYAITFLQLVLHAQLGSLLAGLMSLGVLLLRRRPLVLFPVFTRGPAAWLLYRLGFVYGCSIFFWIIVPHKEWADEGVFLALAATLCLSIALWWTGARIDRLWLEEGPVADWFAAHVVASRLAALGAVDFMIAASVAHSERHSYTPRWSPLVRHFFEHGMDVLPLPVVWLSYSLLGAILFGAIGWPLDLLRQRYRVVSASS